MRVKVNEGLVKVWLLFLLVDGVLALFFSSNPGVAKACIGMSVLLVVIPIALCFIPCTFKVISGDDKVNNSTKEEAAAIKNTKEDKSTRQKQGNVESSKQLAPPTADKPMNKVPIPEPSKSNDAPGGMTFPELKRVVPKVTISAPEVSDDSDMPELVNEESSNVGGSSKHSADETAEVDLSTAVNEFFNEPYNDTGVKGEKI